MQSRIKDLLEVGQSLWLDNINRSLLEKGTLREWINQGLRGLTSNPTIFDQAISSGPDYDKRIAELKSQGKSTFEIYDALSIALVQEAADLFLPVYEASSGYDGFVSLEIDPRLAHDVQASAREGQRLFQSVNRPNLMIKVPATDAGYEVIERLLIDGINVNATLIFSLEQYSTTAQTFLKAMQALSKNNPSLLKKVHSVASVFISRLDSTVDQMLEKLLTSQNITYKQKLLKSLAGKAALANAQLIFDKHLKIFSERSFKQLKDKGASLQRIVWASTSTKNRQYSDLKYVTGLMFSSTVNTLPEKTLEAFAEHGQVKAGLSVNNKDALDTLSGLKEFAIDIDLVCAKLLDEGVRSFEKSFLSLLNSIEIKSRNLIVSTT